MYGILKSTVNNGLDSELVASFIAPISVYSNRPGFQNDTANLSVEASSGEAQRWEIEATIGNTVTDTRSFFVHNIVNNFSKDIYVRMPQIFIEEAFRTPVGMNTKPVLTMASTKAARAEIIDVLGLVSGNMAVGEFIQFSNHQKVYVVVEAGVNGTGCKIFPKLLQQVPFGVEIKYGDKVTMKGKYHKDNVFGIQFEDGIMAAPGTWKIVEHWR